MKKFYLLCCIAFLHTILVAQAPQKFSYQAVVRDQNSALITNQKIGVKISVLQNAIQGTAVYEETHNVQSNENGLITLEIGTGKALVGSFSSIDWATGSYFVKNEIDPKGGENYTIVSTNQLISVPYALHAKTAESVVGFSTSGKLPTVSTNKVEEFIPDASNIGLGRHLKITHTVTDDGGETVLKRGFCISESPNPTTAGKTISNGDGNTLGASDDYFFEVTSNKKYYVRAFAVNTKGTAYGNEMVITTMDIKIPTVSTISVTDVSYREATVAGNVDNTGNQKPRIGFCIGTQAGISTSNAMVMYCDSITNFSAKFSKLQHSTTYYVRAFAENIAGIGYGNELSFSTLKIFKPNIQTISVDSVDYTNATISGKIINDGGDAIEISGMCIGTTNTPTINDIFAYNNNGNGTSIQATTNNLAPNTTYYARAYAKNSAGETYGNAIKFSTLTIDIKTNEVSEISLFEATFSGELKHNGNFTNFETGFCYSEHPNPTSSDLIASNWYNTNPFTVNANNLNSNTTYYVRAYIRINGNYAYGNEVTFKTPSITLTTLPVTNIKGTKANVDGIVSDSSVVTQNINLGFCYGTSPNPTINDLLVNNWNNYGSSKLQSQITDLKPNTTYYVRAFIKSNSNKVVYGNEVSFTSGTVKLPTITTDSVSEINLYQARFFKTIVDDGGEVSEEGFCIATHTIPTIKDIVNSGYTNDLNMNTKYYVRAYAKNAAGIVYGNELTFKTLSLTLTTLPVSNIKGTKAYLTGKVSDSIAALDKLLGFCYGTSPNPSINNIVVNNWNYNKSTDFQYEISGLKQNTLYYVKSFIQSNNGKIIYGNEVSFTSGSVKLPTITTDSVSEINLHAARLHKTIVDDGGENISEQGFCLATHTAPTTKDILSNDYNANYIDIGNLQINTKYYVRAYAKNSIGIAYGNEISFTTANLKVETVSITKVTFASAEIKAKVTVRPKSNQSWNTYIYFLISKKANPTFTDNELVLNEWASSDSLTKIYKQFEPATTYFVKAAYIYNYSDTAYGATLSFTTKTAPKVETFAPTKISSNDVVFSGSNENSNGYIFTQRGFIVSTKPNISYTNQEMNISSNNGGGIGSFEATGGFKPNTTYYVKAYIASNDGLSVYGNELSFKTLAVGHKGQGGGIVFYDKGETTDGWRYLEVAPNDQSAGAVWGCKDIQIDYWNQNNNLGGGLANTNDIMSKCKDLNSAASICDNLVLGGKTDWYLPNIQELSLVYNNIHMQNLGNFNQVYYWSSSSYGFNNAYLFGINGGDQQNYDTQFTGSVRAIRRY